MTIETGQVYRNRLGAVLTISSPASRHFAMLGGDGIWIARSEAMFGPREYLVTAGSLVESGYALVATDDQEPQR